MDTTHWAAVALFCITAVLYHYWFPQHMRPSRQNHRTYVRKQRAIADFSALNARDLSDRLTSRALPNARLIRAFGIANSFTTEDIHTHNRFLESAKGIILNMDSKRWVNLSQVAEQALDLTLDYFKPAGENLPLAPVSRAFCFIVILNILFHVDPKHVDVSHARAATDAINRLWVQSKDPLQAVSQEDQYRLQVALRELLPGRFPCHPEERPLNLIMPAYETMWRVVLLTFVSAKFRSDRDTAAQFQGVIESVPHCFGRNDVDEKVTLAFAMEGLRLYPPTKTIYRGVPGANGTRDTYTLRAASVQTCHHDYRIWGPDALQFRPSRFCNEDHRSPRLTMDMRRAYMPFGVG